MQEISGLDWIIKGGCTTWSRIWSAHRGEQEISQSVQRLTQAVDQYKDEVLSELGTDERPFVLDTPKFLDTDSARTRALLEKLKDQISFPVQDCQLEKRRGLYLMGCGSCSGRTL